MNSAVTRRTNCGSGISGRSLWRRCIVCASHARPRTASCHSDAPVNSGIGMKVKKRVYAFQELGLNFFWRAVHDVQCHATF